MHKEVTEALNRLGLDTSPSRADVLIHYLERVRTAGLNLVSAADRQRLIERHLIPSLEALPWIPRQGRLLDLGSGGGFPGIPIAWARPELEILLVESNQRKAAFLARVSRETPFPNVRVQGMRIEDLARNEIGLYDIITVRSVAEIKKIISWTNSLLSKSGLWVLWKGQGWRSELPGVRQAIELETERRLSDGSILLILKTNLGTTS